MNKNTNESWNYAKYRTFCILSEEMIREYGRAAWMERADELYEKVKKKIMELPIAEAEKQMKQVDMFFQNILEGKSVTVETGFQGTSAGGKTMGQASSSATGTKNTEKTTGTTTQKTPQRPRLKLTGICPTCKKKTYLQFTDGYFCPDCNAIRVTGTMDGKKKELQDRMKKVLFDYKTSPEKSIHELKAMLAYDSQSAQLYERLGLAYRQRGDNESAMRYYQKAVELDDRDGVIYSNIGVLSILQGNYNEAKNSLEKAYACWEKGDYTDWKPEVMFANYAIALHKTGSQEKAFRFLQEAYDGGYENCEIVFMDWGVGKELVVNKVCELIHKPEYPYSSNLKRDNATIQKVRKHFAIKDSNQIYYFFDFTVFGRCKEGLAVCTDGIHFNFRTRSPEIRVIKWYELGQYEFSLIVDKNISVKKKEKDGSFSFFTMFFLQKQDGTNFLNVLWQMQKL